MVNPIHILNGDALKEQFPSSIPGDFIVLRECLVDGNVHGDSKAEFYTNRAKFISSQYQGISEKDYYKNTSPELDKLSNIPTDKVVHLWFEVDLFCQVNLWYAIHEIYNSGFSNSVYLIRPTTDLEFGFGGMVESDMIIAFTSKIDLSAEDQSLFSSLWENYQNSNTTEVIRIGNKLNSKFPYLNDTISAWLDSLGDPGRPKDTLNSIMKELGTREFGLIFREFSKRESIYGYGDLQVKRLYDELIH